MEGVKVARLESGERAGGRASLVRRVFASFRITAKGEVLEAAILTTAGGFGVKARSRFLRFAAE